MRRYGLILTATVVLATGVAGTTGAVVPGTGGNVAVNARAAIGNDAGTSALTAPGKAERRALRNCRKIKKSNRRKACLRRVHRRFNPVPIPEPSPAPSAVIDVRDKYFSPNLVNIKSGDSILWVWNSVNSEAHNVNLVTGPSGVNRIDFSTPSSPSVGATFKRTFTVPGTYDFVCSIHHKMTMTVEVSK